jgi:hypothetical protein
MYLRSTQVLSKQFGGDDVQVSFIEHLRNTESASLEGVIEWAKVTSREDVRRLEFGSKLVSWDKT